MPFGLGSSSQLGIGIALKLNDQFSGRAARVNQELVAMRKNANSAVFSAMRDYRNQALGIATVAAGATMGLFSMAKAGAQYGHAINQIFIVGGKELGRTRRQLDDFAQSMSKTFTQSPLSVAAAMFENVKQGVRDGLEDITKYQIAVATATDEQIAGPNGVAANLLNIMNAMDIPQEKFGDVANAVTAVANATQSSVYDLGEAMQYGAFTAHQFNLPLTTTLALFGKLSQVGIRGSSAGTGLNNMLTQMAKGLGPFQTKSQLQAWHMMGLDPKQIMSMVDQGNITGVIKAVSDATSHMTATQKGSIIPKAFNIRGTRAIEGLFDSKNGNKTIASILREAEAGVKGDISMKQSKAMMNDFWGDLNFLTNAFHRFRNEFATAVAPTVRVLLKVISKTMGWASSILSTPIGKVLAGIATVVIPTIGVLFAFRTALLTATIALRGFGMTNSIGGFGGLMGAGLNLAGLSFFGNKGANVTKNAAGRYFYPAGTVNAAGKKIGGQLVSKAALTEMGLASGAVAGRTVGLLGTIGGLLGRAIPWIGGIYVATQLLEQYGKAENEGRKSRTDPLLAEYYKNMDEAYYGKANRTPYYLLGGKSGNIPGGQNGIMNQQILINLDGRTIMDNKFQNHLDGEFNRDILFTQPY